MLPPFRIKGIVGHPLHRKRPSKNDAELGSDGSAIEGAEFEVQGDGVVQVSASEYDQTITELPAAKLRYQDEDDGEIVVVGSSLELSQLIGELLSSNYCLPLSTLNAEKSPDMHTFEILQTVPVVDTWRRFRLRTVSNSISGLPSGQTIHPSHSRPFETSRCSINTLPSSAHDTNNLPVRHKPSEAPPSWRDSYLQTMADMDYKEYYASDAEGSKAKAAETNSDPNLKSEGSSSSGRFITEEGKKQAHAAGRRLRDAHKAYWPELLPGPPVDEPDNFWRTYEPTLQFCEGPFTKWEREPESPESPVETSSKPLLSQFEAELSRLMEQNTEWEAPPATTTDPTEVPAKEPISNSPSAETLEPEMDSAKDPTSNSASTEAPNSAEALSHIVTVFGKSFQSLLSRVTLLTTELAARLPEVEHSVTNLQHHVPDQMQTTIHETLQAMGSHIQTLAGIMQQAATSARSSSTATSEAERLVTAQLNNLRTLASDIREVGGSLIASFEKGPKPQNDCGNTGLDANANSSDPALAPEAVNPAATNIFIGNLPPYVTEEAVITALANQGFVGTVTLPKDSLTGDHACFCYVTFPSTYAAAAALQALRGTSIGEYSINVEATNEPLHQGSNTAVAPPEDPIVHSTSELACKTTEAEGPHMGFNFPVIELDNGTSPTLAYQRLLTSSQSEPADIPEPEGQDNIQPPPKTALLDESESNLAERYPSLFACQGINNVDLNLQHDMHGTPPSASNSHDFRMDRYPPMRQLELQPPFMPEPQPFGTRPLANYRISMPDHRALERNINASGVDELSGPPVPDRLPGSWPWDQETQQNNVLSRGIPAENLSDPIHTFRMPSPGQNRNLSMKDYQMQLMLLEQQNKKRLLLARQIQMEEQNSTAHSGQQPPLDQDQTSSNVSSPFIPHHDRFASFTPAGTSSLRRSATERVRRPPPRTSAFHPYPQRRSSNHELPEIINDREHHSNFPGTFPRETQAPSITETPLNDKTEVCLSHLRALGFGNDRSQDANRLRIFAQAADGNLEEAIEMIEEERKAYEQGPVLL
ncbi:hypothetical protein FQN49_001118 [Arthroderma sp. PD_2]|nr:hypothetical protein FQN49_001118 [Arthroderma sp. PD_2]